MIARSSAFNASTLCLTLCLAAGASCVSSPKPTTGPVASKPVDDAPVAVVDQSKPGEPGTPGPDEDMQPIDTNNDKQPDIFKFFVRAAAPTSDAGSGGGLGRLLRKEIDLNHDGRIDIWKWYGTDGVVEREQFDLDFDGRLDVIAFYEKGVVVRKEAFHGTDRPDTFKFYEKGRLVRVERDRLANDGKVDTWEYYEGDDIDRIGEDLDGDGNVDNWIKRTVAK